MIEVNGNRFRFLKDPLYANGRRVKKVLCNGMKVYPEDTSEGNLIKILGWTNVYVSHSHNGVRPQPASSWYDTLWFKEGTVSFGVMASFSAAIKLRKPARVEKSPVRINLQRNYHDTIRSGYAEDKPYYCSAPLVGLQDQITKSIDFGSNNALIDYVDFIYKLSITPPPMCPYYYFVHHASLGWLTEYFYEFTPHEPYLFNACEYNGKTFRKRWENISFCRDSSYTDDYGRLFFDSHRGEHGRMMTKAVVDTKCPVYWGPVSSKLYGMSIKLEGYSMMYDRKNMYNGTVTKDYYAGPLNDIIALIPITHILYAGDISEAPESAKTVSESDLF